MKKTAALLLAFLMLALAQIALWGCALDSAPDSSDTDNDNTGNNNAELLNSADPLTDTQDDADSPEFEYMSKLFGNGIIKIEIYATTEDWQWMLDNAANEEYIPCDVVVNGTKFSNVGIRPKGNSSLSQVVSSDSDRYSFRLNFDKYVEGQTCFGLTNFVLNNMISDTSYLKEYISYDIMTYIGVDSPLFEYASISVNGEAWGFYLAVEKYDDEFLTRTYGDDKGELYSVKMNDGGNMGNIGAARDTLGNNNRNNSIPEDFNPEDFNPGGSIPENFIPENFAPNGNWGNDANNGGRMGAGNSGGSLQYNGDDPENYSSIFENNVSKIDDDDKTKVIEALKALSEGDSIDIESYFNVDQILRYFAAHTVVVNLDSYVSSMAQNYYLYERDGQLTILPWDYNLAFGGFQSGTASDIVNFPIDTPVSGVTMESRPLLSKLLENEEYLERYHQYLQEIVSGYLNTIDVKIAELQEKISAYVESDPTKFCTYAEYEKAADTLTALIMLRSESIQGQLDGTIPSTSEGQKSDSKSLIDASAVNTNDLGTMGGGGGMGGRR